MQENCTYGSMRGRAYPTTRGAPLYSTPFDSLFDSLDLPSYVDGIAEYVPGITPYRWNYGMPPKAVEMVYGGNKSLATRCPVWRRWGNIENQTVAASEYTVWETSTSRRSVRISTRADRHPATSAPQAVGRHQETSHPMTSYPSPLTSHPSPLTPQLVSCTSGVPRDSSN